MLEFLFEKLSLNKILWFFLIIYQIFLSLSTIFKTKSLTQKIVGAFFSNLIVNWLKNQSTI